MQLSEVPHPGAGRRPVPAHRSGPLRGAAVVLPDSRRCREPRLADEAGLHRACITNGNPPTEIPRPDGRTSGRRLALAQWIASPQNPMPARVIVNRLWQKHFGRGIVATLDNFGKMGEQPTHQELLDWLAVEFMNSGWSMKQINKLMMMSEAYQMASAFEDAASAEAIRRTVPVAVPPAAPRSRRSCATTCWPSAATSIWRSAANRSFRHRRRTSSPASIAASGSNTPDGPAAWRRGIYVYQRRSLPYPMFDTFDHPDMNVTAGARTCRRCRRRR